MTVATANPDLAFKRIVVSPFAECPSASLCYVRGRKHKVTALLIYNTYATDVEHALHSCSGQAFF